MDLARLEAILARLDPDDAAWLAEQLEPAWRRRRRRLDQRDGWVREVAQANFADFDISGRQLHATIARDQARYAASGYLIERDRGPPADPARRRLWEILQLNGGRPMSVSSVRDALAGGVIRNQRRLLDSARGNQAAGRKPKKGS